ncbi:MAG: hypothetical protein CMK59_06460 [Proteobacteria bacterium]|nr:hypothetical protein [Pseudomonadota bacterium]
MIYELTSTELIRLGVTFIASISHIFTAILGFQVSRFHQPARNMFTLAILLLAWSTLTLGLGYGGIGKYHPRLIYLSPMLSGFILPSFYLYIRTVVNPHNSLSFLWFLFGIPGFCYGMSGLFLERGYDFALMYIEGKNEQSFYPLLHNLFIIHSLGMLFLSCSCQWITLKAFLTTNDSQNKNTLSWLLAVLGAAWIILLTTNVLPLLGMTQYLPFLPLMTILISSLSYRALRGLVSNVLRETEVDTEIQSVKMESLGRMARGIAHDINNMLSGIIGHTELAKLHLDNPQKLEHHLEQIKTIGLRAGNLHTTLLTYSGKGKASLEFSTDITQPIKEAISIVEPQIRPNINLNIYIAKNLPLVAVSAQSIHRAILNLLLNSIEAMENRTGNIDLTVGYERSSVIPPHAMGRELDGAPTIYIEIKDDGIGMSDEISKKVLDPFFSTKKTGEGLGLVSVLSMIRDANAALAHHSTVQEGCTFQIWLPIHKTVSKSPPQSNGNHHINLKILVVDDDHMVLETLKELLELLDVEVLTATNGLDAIEICNQEQDITTILLDVRMEGLDGFETAKALEKQTIKKHIIFMSGDEPKYGLLQESTQGEHMFLRKPIQLRQLKVLIDEFKETHTDIKSYQTTL